MALNIETLRARGFWIGALCYLWLVGLILLAILSADSSERTVFFLLWALAHLLIPFVVSALRFLLPSRRRSLFALLSLLATVTFSIPSAIRTGDSMIEGFFQLLIFSFIVPFNWPVYGSIGLALILCTFVSPRVLHFLFFCLLLSSVIWIGGCVSAGDTLQGGL